MRVTTQSLLVLMLTGIFTGAGQAATYKYVDDGGNTIYSDTPRPGAVEIEEREVQTVPADRVTPLAPRQDSKKKTQAYQQVTITSPQNDQVFQANTESVSVAASVVPTVQYGQGHTVVLKINGTPHGKPGTATNFNLSNLPRGSYQASVSILDRQGKTLISSKPISFHVKRHFKKP